MNKPNEYMRKNGIILGNKNLYKEGFDIATSPSRIADKDKFLPDSKYLMTFGDDECCEEGILDLDVVQKFCEAIKDEDEEKWYEYAKYTMTMNGVIRAGIKVFIPVDMVTNDTWEKLLKINKEERKWRFDKYTKVKGISTKNVEKFKNTILDKLDMMNEDGYKAYLAIGLGWITSSFCVSNIAEFTK